jgi:exonuclease SbcC
VLITRIELQNIKSYLDDSITFAAGANAICGENGAGKSTLLEAIGFTLFDYLPYTHADFVRQGEKAATIAVSFLSNQDGREYQVVRRCGGSSDYYVYDAELDAKLVAGKADVLDWLKEHLGVEPSADLPALFRDAVGVPQGLLTAPFLQTTAQRKPLFDRLLRVDEYEQAWKTLRETQRYLEDRLAGHRESIAGLESQVQRLPGLQQRAAALRGELAGIEDRLVELGAELGEATARREALEATKEKLDGLRQRVEMLTARLEGVLEQLAAAETAVAQAEAAQSVVEASRPGYDAYQAAQLALAGLEAERAQRDSLKDERVSQEQLLALSRAGVKRLEADLEEVEGAEALMQALQPQVERQMELETALKAAQAQVRRLEVAEAQVTERSGRLDDLRARLEAVQLGLAQAEQIEAELRQARAQLEAARRSLGDLHAERAALGAETKRLAEQTQTLETGAGDSQGRAALCPVCEQPLTPQHRAELMARNQAQLDELYGRDRTLAEGIAAAANTGSALEQSVNGLESQLRDLPRPADQEDLATQVARLEGELVASQAEVERLAEERQTAASLEGQLAELGDPRRQYERPADQAGRRAGLEERLEAERHAAGALEASLAEIERALAPFADLDRCLAEERTRLGRHEEAHRRYLEHAQAAAELPARRALVETLRVQEAEVTAERDAAQAQAEEIAADFDPQALAAARQHEAGLQSEQARLEGQLSRLRQEVADAGREIDELEEAERALVAEQAAMAGHQQVLALAEFIREVIRRAGPYVTRRLLQQVSLEAARLFSDVMADHTGRLRWQENYDIVLEKDGRERSFQQLSGGEQMAAALAVRLALLRELSAIDVAFFDEPTSNLDDTRRDSLAEQILSVKGFSQLFVISHDDTFERVTNHTVRVRKENGVSKVEVG